MDLEQQPQAPQERPFKDYFSPLTKLSTSCIRYPNVTTMSFELKPGVLNCVLSFYGQKNKFPYNHLNNFQVFAKLLNIKVF